MPRLVAALGLLTLLLAAAPVAMAQFVFRMGDSVYVDGHKYSLEEWKKIRDHYQPPSDTAAPSAVASARADATASSDEPRAASCISSMYYDQFPGEAERFNCTQGLGALTREEILRRGWKVDFVDKVPAPAGQSTRGLPLYQYKLVISR